MQQWPTQRGQCLTCLLRLTKRDYLQTTSRRFSSTTTEQSERAKKRAAFRTNWEKGDTAKRRSNTRDVAFDKSAQQSPGTSRWSILGSGRRDGREAGRRRGGGFGDTGMYRQRTINDARDVGDAETQDGEHAPVRFRVRGTRTLGLLKEQLETTKVKKEETTLMEALDPDGQQWPIFEERMRKVFEGEVRSEPGLRKIHKNLSQVMLQHSYQDTGKRQLHYTFIDQVVASQKDSQQTEKRVHATDLRYPTEWYMGARAVQRDIHLHVGPTNSGKTYNALKRLEASGNGFYAGPLRLLAHEVYSRFKAKNIPVDLVTGDDVRRDESDEVKMASSTVEMVDVGRPVEVAVVDEIQMMADADRGWAWTRAVLGANAKELHLCGEARVVPLIKELAASMGDKLEIHEYERLNPLKAMSQSLNGNLKNLRKGDCIVSFSILRIHALKKEIEVATGRRVAIVYGGLPPETRAQQAAFFNDPNNDYDFLVASDAIGMGLNLSIKRIIFEEVTKWNGSFRERLSIPQIKQIAGRAGRFRSSRDATHSASTRTAAGEKPVTSIGLVTCLQEDDLPIIHNALNVEAPPIRAAGLLPPIEIVEEYAARLPKGVPFTYVYERLCQAATLNPRFTMCEIDQSQTVAKAIDYIEPMTIAQRCTFSAAPLTIRNTADRDIIQALAKCVAAQQAVTIVDIAEIPLEILDEPLSPQRDYLASLEALHKSLILYLWLSYRFVDIFKDKDMAFHAKELVEDKINVCLLEFSANPKLRKETLRRRNFDMGKFFGPSVKSPDSLNDVAEPEVTNRELDDHQPLAGEQDSRDDDSDLTYDHKAPDEPQIAVQG